MARPYGRVTLVRLGFGCGEVVNARAYRFMLMYWTTADQLLTITVCLFSSADSSVESLHRCFNPLALPDLLLRHHREQGI